MGSQTDRGESLTRRSLFLFLILTVAGCGSLAYIFRLRLDAVSEMQRQTQGAREEAARVRAQTLLPTEKQVPAGQHFAAALQKFGLSAADAAGAAAAAQRAFNLRQVRAGNAITVNRSVDGELREIDYKIDADRMLKITPAENGFAAEVREIPSRLEVAVVAGQIDDSLFNAVEQAGESAELAMHLA